MLARRPWLSLVLALADCRQERRDDLGAPATVAEATRMIFGPTFSRKFDVLLVVDDSSTMAGIQGLVAANMSAFVNELEDASSAVDYRIGIVTASAEHPACPDVVGGGELRMTSCRERLDDFSIDGATTGCSDDCDFAAIRTLPTTTDAGPTARARPWLEQHRGVSNLAPIDGRTPTTQEAMQCIGPQGVAGCGFQSPLEAMYRALSRMQDVDDPQYGFLRIDASLLVVILTSSSDCSVVPEYASLFAPASEAGNPVFWSDRNADAPTPAACWNAGAECTGEGPIYDACDPVNHAATGQPEVDDADAVLQPLSRYVALLQGVEAAKRAIDPDLQVMVELITGVPSGYEDRWSEVYYADATDLAEQLEYGIGAGCVDDAITPPFSARPPVRELALAEAMRIDDDRNAISICTDDWSPALRAIAEPIPDVLKPACMPVCVADGDPETPELEPICHLDWSATDGEGKSARGVVEVCNADESLPDGEDACAVMLTDENISDFCAGEGWNLEFRLLRREGTYWPTPTVVTATCLVSLDRETDCPSLP